MALWRSGARRASRHTGLEYGRGFQFGYPERKTLEFGPWDSVWPLGDRDLPRNVLYSLKDGVVVDGIIQPIWNRTSTNTVDETIVAADEMSLTGSRYRVTLAQNAAGNLKAYYSGESVSGVDTSAIAITTDRISMAPWQRYVYLASLTLGLVRRYSPIDNAFVDVAGSPTNGKFVFILNNNLVVIRRNGDIWEAKWSVDSLPEDFVGAGSGATPLSGIGEPRGVGIINDRAIIVGSAGAKVMVPTGGLPAFAFQDLTEIKGTPFDYAVDSSEDALYYFGYDYQLRVFSESGQRTVGEGEGRLSGTPLLYYSRRLGKLIVTLQGEDKTLFLDPDTGKWVSDLDIAWNFVTDAPVAGATGRVLGYENTVAGFTEHILDLDPAGLFTLPRISFGLVTLPQEFVIEYIDIQRTHRDSPQPLAMTFRRLLQSDMEQDDVFSPVGLATIKEIGERLRYYINRPAFAFQTDLYVAGVSAVLSSGPFLLSLMTSDGNIPIDPLNPPSGVRGDIELDGNMDVDATSTEYYSSGGLDTEGNLDLELAAQDEWLRDTGIVGLTVRLKKQSLEEV